MEKAFLPVETVTVRLGTQDKIPCVDGWIEVRNGGSQNKSSIIGRIDVQVKGTKSKPKSHSHFSKSVAMSDLRHFRDTCYGALYFVVSLKTDLTVREIYYAQFLPFDIDQLISGKESQNTIKVKLKKLPNNPLVLERLCREFIEDKKRQSGDLLVGFKTIEEWKSSGFGTDKYVLSKNISNPADLASLATWENGGYVYTETTEGCLHAIKRIEPPDAIEIGTETTFRTNFFCTKMMLMHGDSPDGSYLKFGSFEIWLGQNPKLKYTPQGSFQELYRDAQLAQGMCRTGSLEIGSLILSDITFNELSQDEIDERVTVLGKYDTLINTLKIKIPLIPNELTDKDIKQLGRLGAAFVDGLHQPISNTDEQLVNLDIELTVGRIKVIGRMDEEGKYEFWNPLENDTVCLLVKDHLDNPDHYKPLPSSFILTKDDFKQTINIDSQTFGKTLDEVPVCRENSESANAKLLEMLDAYDEGALCEGELIQCCCILAEKLLLIDPDNQVSQINMLQSVVRMRELNRDERSKLRKIIISPRDKMTLAAAYILNDNKELAEETLQQLSDEERTEFHNWPISSLLNR